MAGPWEKYKPTAGPWEKYAPADDTSATPPAAPNAGLSAPANAAPPEFMNPLPTENIPIAGAALQPFGEVAAGLRYDPKFRKDTYEGARSGAMAATAPLAVGAKLPAIAGGLVGGALGEYGGGAAGEKLGLGPMGQEVAGDVGGLAGGAMGGAIGNEFSSGISRLGGAAARATPILGKAINAWEASAPKEYPVGAKSDIVTRPGPDVGFKEAMPKVGAKSARVVGPGFGSADATVGAVKKLPVHPGIEPISPAAPPAAPAPLPETMIAPVPRAPIPGVPPGSMQSVPRPDLPGHVLSGQPGAAEAFQAIGGKPIFLTPGAQFEMAQPGVASGRPPVQHMPTLSSYGQSVYPAGYAPEVPMANSAPVPQITGPEMMNRLNAYGAGPAHPSAAPMIRNVMVPLEGESGMPKFNERGQRLGIEPINAPEGSAQEVNKADHPDYNEKGQKLGTPPQEDEDVGAKVRRENPEPTRAEVEEGERKKKSGSK